MANPLDRSTTARIEVFVDELLDRVSLPPQRHREARADFIAHLTADIERQLEQGSALDEAAEEAFARFDPEATRAALASPPTPSDAERSPARPSSPGMRALPADVRFALRRWRRRPGFAATAILTLALGIGATTSVFSVVDAVIIQPLPWPEPERLVVIHGVYHELRQDPASAATWNRGTLTCQMWDALRSVSAFEDVAVWFRLRDATMTLGDTRKELVSHAYASSNLLSVLGARVAIGRPFEAAEDLDPGRRLLLPFETWRDRFGSDPDVVGTDVMFGTSAVGGAVSRTRRSPCSMRSTASPVRCRTLSFGRRAAPNRCCRRFGAPLRTRTPSSS